MAEKKSPLKLVNIDLDKCADQWYSTITGGRFFFPIKSLPSIRSKLWLIDSQLQNFLELSISRQKMGLYNKQMPLWSILWEDLISMVKQGEIYTFPNMTVTTDNYSGNVYVTAPTNCTITECQPFLVSCQYKWPKDSCKSCLSQNHKYKNLYSPLFLF